MPTPVSMPGEGALVLPGGAVNPDLLLRALRPARAPAEAALS
nr:hypothetical protein [Micromonospora sp. DSM 115978]